MEGYRYFHFEVHIELKFEILLALDIYNHNFVTFIIVYCCQIFTFQEIMFNDTHYSCTSLYQLVQCSCTIR